MVCDVTLVDQPRSSSYHCYLEGLVGSITLASPALGKHLPRSSNLGFTLYLPSTSDRHIANRKAEQLGDTWGMAEDPVNHP